MLELLTIVIFAWLLFKTIGLTLRLTWGIAKIISGILMLFALPLLIVGLLFVGGIVIFIPIIMLCVAAGITKACLDW
ncbi:MAG: hypothetical protein IKC03_10770 [Oscillospiraceae bacterium]|nr:hypothetical protein [Oscillospiraceae bacterium]